MLINKLQFLQDVLEYLTDAAKKNNMSITTEDTLANNGYATSFLLKTNNEITKHSFAFVIEVIFTEEVTMYTIANYLLYANNKKDWLSSKVVDNIKNVNADIDKSIETLHFYFQK